MGHKIIFLVVAGLLENCLLTNFINGERIFPGPQALPWVNYGCVSPFDGFVLALPVVILLRNLLGQRSIGSTMPARTTPTTPARTTPARTTLTTLAPITTTPAPACPASYSLYDQSCGRFCYRYVSSDCQDWRGAQEACQKESGDLLEPSECNYEFFRVRTQQNEGSCQKHFWLGARRSTNGGNFITVKGNVISDKANIWGTDQPNNDGNQNCLEMSSDIDNYKANDFQCDEIQGYICQII